VEALAASDDLIDKKTLKTLFAVKVTTPSSAPTVATVVSSTLNVTRPEYPGNWSARNKTVESLKITPKTTLS
jgi:hypothetical protein